jgi:hypothetical protein
MLRGAGIFARGVAKGIPAFAKTGKEEYHIITRACGTMKP